MFHGADRQQLRQYYFDIWQKHCNRELLQPLEALIVDVLMQHPEYHAYFNDPQALEQDFTPEMGQSNPFLHMGLHLALLEQIQTNRPLGITAIYQRLLERQQDVHHVAHAMMECLAEAVWSAQRNQTAPDEMAYLECLKKMA